MWVNITPFVSHRMLFSCAICPVVMLLLFVLKYKYCAAVTRQPAVFYRNILRTVPTDCRGDFYVNSYSKMTVIAREVWGYVTVSRELGDFWTAILREVWCYVTVSRDMGNFWTVIAREVWCYVTVSRDMGELLNTHSERSVMLYNSITWHGGTSEQ